MKLTSAQRRVLILVMKGNTLHMINVTRRIACWDNMKRESMSTINALVRRGLLSVKLEDGYSGWYEITAAGIAALEEIDGQG